ncbi:hypothetical protein [Streptosporangium sp. OZ121]|uniref:hypothetical protein n=1 Tax=Streptosporangium sp. OZ121 TaxID=3444183 RepID=UPI003F79FC23
MTGMRPVDGAIGREIVERHEAERGGRHPHGGEPRQAVGGGPGTIRDRVNAGVIGRPNSWWTGVLACADVRRARHAHVLRAGVAGG